MNENYQIVAKKILYGLYSVTKSFIDGTCGPGGLFQRFSSPLRPFSAKLWLNGRTAEIESLLVFYPHRSRSHSYLINKDADNIFLLQCQLIIII